MTSQNVSPAWRALWRGSWGPPRRRRQDGTTTNPPRHFHTLGGRLLQLPVQGIISGNFHCYQLSQYFSLNAPETQYMPLLPAEDCLEEPSEGIEAHLLCHRHAPRPMCNSEIVDSAMEKYWHSGYIFSQVWYLDMAGKILLLMLMRCYKNCLLIFLCKKLVCACI